MNPLNLNNLQQSAEALRTQLNTPAPSMAAILGSGWGEAIAEWTILDTIPYSDIPILGATAVKGHAGRLHLADTGNGICLVFQGRRHRYESFSWDPVIFPVYLAHTLGARTLLLTNAAGGIRADLNPGDLLMIDDHINAMGGNPLQGPHHTELGPRFPDLTQLYTPTLRHALASAACQHSIPVKHGIYLAVAGPSYETPAEIRAYAAQGADVVGMSTAPEAIFAGALGMNVAGLCCVTNRAAASGNAALQHDDVIAVTQAATPHMHALVHLFTHCAASHATPTPSLHHG